MASPGEGDQYDLTAPLNKLYFANAFTFQSVIAEVRFQGNQLSEVVLHPVELGYGKRGDDQRNSEARRG